MSEKNKKKTDKLKLRPVTVEELEKNGMGMSDSELMEQLAENYKKGTLEKFIAMLIIKYQIDHPNKPT